MPGLCNLCRWIEEYRRSRRYFTDRLFLRCAADSTVICIFNPQLSKILERLWSKLGYRLNANGTG